MVQYSSYENKKSDMEYTFIRLNSKFDKLH